MDRVAEKLTEVLSDIKLGSNSDIDYLLLPSNYQGKNPVIDWSSVCSASFCLKNVWKDHVNCNGRVIQTKSGLLCTCSIQKSLVYTPHNGHSYIIYDFLNNLNANSLLKLSNGSVTTYKEYYEQR